MKVPDGSEIAWFVSGMWATFFVIRATRARGSGFFGIVALLVVGVAPALGLIFEKELVVLAGDLYRSFSTVGK